MSKEVYRRMYETKQVRPYYTIAHLGLLGKPFRQFVGFEYRKTVYVISSDMSNAGYFDVAEMDQATEFFRTYWEDIQKVQQATKSIYDQLKKVEESEQWAFSQTWKQKSTADLLTDMQGMFEIMFATFVKMFISQPQHVLPLDEKLNALLEPHSNRDELLRTSTYFKGDLPWAEEDREIEKLHASWQTVSKEDQEKVLADLMKKYGWFNEIEGNKPFGEQHYRQKIEQYKAEHSDIPQVVVPDDIQQVGGLIGELGFLRFWTRYHFMTLRYHLKKILEELTARSGKPILEFATVAEMERFYKKEKIDFDEIERRSAGYAAVLEDGEAKLVTGKRLGEIKDLVKEDFSNIKEIKGSIANKGKVQGRVRVVSFVAQDYDEQVAAFQDREILVTGMTRPQIVHLCQKAAAIVTDEGGITSHAAVVAREFNIPCIIATRNATKVLKTGDLVEVDANKGIVTILK